MTRYSCGEFNMFAGLFQRGQMRHNFSWEFISFWNTSIRYGIGLSISISSKTLSLGQIYLLKCSCCVQDAKQETREPIGSTIYSMVTSRNNMVTNSLKTRQNSQHSFFNFSRRNVYLENIALTRDTVSILYKKAQFSS